MQARYEVTLSDHLEMLKARFGISAKLPVILLGTFGTCLGIFAYYFFGDTWIVVIVMFATLTLIQIFFPTFFITGFTREIRVCLKCAQ